MDPEEFKTRTATPPTGDGDAIGLYNWDGTCYSVPAHRKQVLIGRKDGVGSGRVDIALTDPEVSSLHCIIERAADDGHFSVSDSSKNGTFINEVHIHKNSVASLRRGDTLRVGQTKFQLMGPNGPDFGPPPHSVETIKAAMRYHKSMRATAAALGTTFHQVQSRMTQGDAGNQG